MYNYIYNRFFELSSPYFDTGKNKFLCKNRFTRILKYLDFKKKKNKYYYADLLIEIYFLLIYPIFFPIAVFLYFNKYKIYIIDNKSFGDFLWEMSVLNNNRKNKKILIPVNSNFYFEIYQKTLFSKLIIIKNIFFSHGLLILNNYNFLHIDILDKKVVIEPKHYINYDYPLDHYKNFKEYILTKKLKKIDFSKKKLNFKKIKEFNLRLKDKNLAIINPRYVLGRNDEIRNSKIDIFLKSINYLKSQNYLIIIFDDSKKFTKFSKIHKIECIDISKEINKLKQICAFYHCDIYIGSYSGMAHLTDLFKNKSIYTDEVFFNSIIANENCYVLPKKIKIKKKIFPYMDNIYNQFPNVNRNKNVLKNISFINISAIDLLKTLKITLNNKKIIRSNKKNQINIAFNFIPKKIL